MICNDVFMDLLILSNLEERQKLIEKLCCFYHRRSIALSITENVSECEQERFQTGRMRAVDLRPSWSATTVRCTLIAPLTYSWDFLWHSHAACTSIALDLTEFFISHLLLLDFSHNQLHQSAYTTTAHITSMSHYYTCTHRTCIGQPTTALSPMKSLYKFSRTFAVEWFADGQLVLAIIVDNAYGAFIHICITCDVCGCWSSCFRVEWHP